MTMVLLGLSNPSFTGYLENVRSFFDEAIFDLSDKVSSAPKPISLADLPSRR